MSKLVDKYDRKLFVVKEMKYIFFFIKTAVGVLSTLLN